MVTTATEGCLPRSLVRQRSRFAWLKRGDASSAFLRVHAAHHRQKNRIFSLKTADCTVFEPAALADAAFDHFSAIIGSSDERAFSLALEEVHPGHFDLAALDQPFSEDEIWHAIKSMPTGKTSGPDGFSAEFLRACWDIMKKDILDAFGKFYSLNARGFQKLNEALFTLLPKRADAESLFDYCPISLIHLIAKLFAKALSLRLAPRLGGMVSANQSTFIAGRSIHNNFLLVQQTARHIHNLKVPRMMLKLDIARAFDSVSWPFLLQILSHLGFGPRWREWISILLATASTRVLVNGVPGHPISHARGLRQGDPLSLMLFTLVIEVLNSLILRAVERGLLRRLTPRHAV